MSLEELLKEHIKALNENTKALNAYTNALGTPKTSGIEVEHTKRSACQFCGISYKTLLTYIENGLLIASRPKSGKREYFKEQDLVALCEAKRLYSGDYGARIGH